MNSVGPYKVSGTTVIGTGRELTPASVAVNGLTQINTSGQIAYDSRVVTARTTALTLTASQSGQVFTNEGASAAFAFTLPAAAVGLNYTFFVMAAYELRVDPNGSETVALPSTGAQSAAGKYIGADAVGEWVRILCVKAGQWQVIGYAGTWTAES